MVHFFTRTCFIYLCFDLFCFTFPDVNQGLSPILSPGDFPGEGGVVPFPDDIHGKYLIKMPKQYAIPLRIERRTHW